MRAKKYMITTLPFRFY